MKFLFDLGGVFFDWDPNYFFKNVFDDDEERKYFLNEVCNDQWNLQQDAGRSVVEAELELIPKFPHFKNEIKTIIGSHVYGKNDGAILEVASKINSTLILIGILGFIACFAFSLGPVMWVLLSEMFPLKFKGLAIGVIAFVNSLISSLVQLVFPWELSNLGNALTFFIFGFIAAVGFLILLKVLPETKGQSLEELEQNLINDL